MNLLSILSRFLWFSVWIALAIYFLFTLWLGLTGLAFPYQLDYGEGIVLWFAREIAHGHAIYKGLAGYPYASSNYPPVAFLLTAALMPIFGDGYAAGRLLNLASALVVSLLIYRIVTEETRDTGAAALAALFFIGSPYVYHWAPLFRIDFIGLAFAMGGLYFVWRWQQRRTKLYFWLFTLFFLLSLYTKQTLIAAPAAAFLALFWRDRRTAVSFAFLLGAIGGVIYLAIDFATHGGFTFGLIDSNATVFLPDQLLALLGLYALVFAILIALTALEWFRRVRQRQFGVLEAYAVTSLTTLVFAGRVGAWENYFFEAIAAVCIFSGFQISYLKSQRSQYLGSGNRSLISTCVLPATLILQLVLYNVPDHDPRTAADIIAKNYSSNQQLASLLSRTNGIVISEDMGALVTSRKDVAYYTFQYSSLARSGKWDQSWELNGLRDGLFPLVILERSTREDVDHYRRFTREFVSALDRYYAQTQKIGNYEIYTPASLEHLQTTDFGDAIAMIGWTSQPENLDSGTMKLSIVWQAKRMITRRYTAFIHLEKADGEKVTQDDHEPRAGLYPTTRWAPGEMVRELYVLNVPEKLAAGKYVLRAGWYDTETGERLRVQGSADDAMVIKTFDVR